MTAFTRQALVSAPSAIFVGTLLIILGLVLALFALALTAARSGKLRARGGAVIIIGPFPIVFGTDKERTKVLLVLSLSIIVALVVLFLLQAL